MNVSKAREIEKDRIYERKLLKERKQEDDLFGDKEKFVTGAYREKLAQEAKWEYEDKYFCNDLKIDPTHSINLGLRRLWRLPPMFGSEAWRASTRTC